MIVLDTSVMIEGMTGGGSLRTEFRAAIAAVAIRAESRLWTLNRRNFEDLPGLLLVGRD